MTAPTQIAEHPSNRNTRSNFLIGLISSLAINGFGLCWAMGWLALGFLGVGMSSGPTAQLEETWNSFVWMALACPCALNPLLLVVILVLAWKRRNRMILLGWLAGLGIAGLTGLVLGGAVTALMYWPSLF
jgi:hypothetical protein